MTPERVYAVLVEANPVPDPDEFLERLGGAQSRLHLVESRRMEMKTQDAITSGQRKREVATARGLRVAFASAIAVVAVAVAIAALVTSWDPSEIGEAPVSDSQRALESVDQFIAALELSDVDAIAAVMEPQAELSAADREMWGFNAELFSAGYGFETGTCSANAPEGATLITVRCGITQTSPLHVAVGVEELVMPFQFNSESGRLGWSPFQGGDISAVNRAATDYLRAFHPADYASSCDPSKFEFGDVHFDQGLALSRNCGRALAPLFDDLAEWVRNGRPQPTG